MIVAEAVAILIHKVAAASKDSITSAAAQIAQTVRIAIPELISIQTPAKARMGLTIIAIPVAILVDKVVANTIAVRIHSLAAGIANRVRIHIRKSIGRHGGFG